MMTADYRPLGHMRNSSGRPLAVSRQSIYITPQLEMDMNELRLEQGNEDFWLRWGWIWSALYFVMLVVPFVIGIMIGEFDANGRLQALILCLISIGWHYWWAFQYPKRLPSRNFRERPLMMLLHLLGIAVSWYFLAQISPIFFYTLFGLFGLFFYFLPLVWAIIAVTGFATVVLVTIAKLEGEVFRLTDPNNLGFLLAIVAASLFAVWIGGIIEQSTNRRELVEALQRTQAELAASERRAGQLEERQRLAHEIHDTLAQGFISIILNLEAADSLMTVQPKQKHYVDLAVRTARESLSQARRVVDDLRPDPLEQSTSLPEAIGRVAERWEQESGTAVSVNITGDPLTLSGKTDVALLRATQEALANVRKHAKADSVQITLSYMKDVVILDVQDDGVGLEAGKGEERRENRDLESGGIPTGGYGLKAMQERVEQLNGSVELESELGEGTTLMVSIPFHKEAV